MLQEGLLRHAVNRRLVLTAHPIPSRLCLCQVVRRHHLLVLQVPHCETEYCQCASGRDSKENIKKHLDPARKGSLCL